MSTVTLTQSQLSEKLLLLRELGYSDLDMATYQWTGLHNNKDIRQDMRILDIITVCLTSGKPGDVIAAAFEKRGKVHLVLAKSLKVVEEDYTRAHQFFSTLFSSNHWTNVLPFLIEHSKANLDKRIQNLHQTISDLLDELLFAATTYKFDESSKVEFPNSNAFMDILFGGTPTNPRRILEDLLRMCRDQSDFEMEPNNASVLRFVGLVTVANALRKSAFLAALIVNNRNLTQLEFKGRVEKLQRRLGKLCQYTRIRHLIKRVQRIREVPFSWVEDQLVDAGEGSFENDLNPEYAIQCALQEQVSKIGHQDLDMDAVYKQYPNLGPNWAQHRIINPRVHAELRIILHLTRSLSSSAALSNPPTQYPIGCSKRSCICCYLWMSAFKERTKMSWMTSGCHGKPYENWALPGPAGEMQEVMVKKVNRIVIDAISMQLVDTLAWAMQANMKFKRISDEHASSGLDTDASVDEAEGYMTKLFKGKVALPYSE